MKGRRIFNDLTNFGIEDPRMTTIGGVYSGTDHLPYANDTVLVDGFAATVLAMEGHRVASVRIAKNVDRPETSGSSEMVGADHGPVLTVLLMIVLLLLKGFFVPKLRWSTPTRSNCATPPSKAIAAPSWP